MSIASTSNADARGSQVESSAAAGAHLVRSCLIFPRPTWCPEQCSLVIYSPQMMDTAGISRPRKGWRRFDEATESRRGAVRFPSTPASPQILRSPQYVLSVRCTTSTNSGAVSPTAAARGNQSYRARAMPVASMVLQLRYRCFRRTVTRQD